MTQPATDTDEKRIEGTSGLTMTIDPVSDSSSGRDSRRSEPPTQATPGSAGSEMDRLGADEESAPFKATKRFLLVFVALSVLTLMVALDGTSISVALPIIADRLNGTGIEAFWAGTSFLLSSTVFQPMFAQTSHIFGRMPMIMLCLAIFLAGVILAGVSKNFTILLAGRTVQGIGGGGKHIKPTNKRHLQRPTCTLSADHHVVSVYRNHYTYRGCHYRSCASAVARKVVGYHSKHLVPG